jgi:hypothetical protein
LIYFFPNFDRQRTVHNAAGLDVPALKDHVAKGQPLASFPGGTALKHKDDVLTLPCDVLIPAALGGVITQDNASKLQVTRGVETSSTTRWCAVASFFLVGRVEFLKLFLFSPLFYSCPNLTSDSASF